MIFFPLSHRRRLCIAAAAMAALAHPVWSAPALPPGAAAPPLELPGLAGTVQLQQYRGKLVYLDFWASWCGPCRQSFPWMNQMQSKYGPRGLQVVAVNLDASGDDARRFLQDLPARFVVAFDPAGRSAHQYGVQGMPSSVLIGPDGQVLARHIGFRSADREPLEAQIRAALGAEQ